MTKHTVFYKALTAVMAVGLVLSLPVISRDIPEFSELFEDMTVTASAEGGMGISSPFTATVPARISAGDDIVISVDASSVDTGYEVAARVGYSGSLTLENSEEETLPYTISNESLPVNTTNLTDATEAPLWQVPGGTVETEKTLTTELEADPKYAGSYTDTVTFNIYVQPETVYSIPAATQTMEYIPIGETGDHTQVLARMRDTDDDGEWDTAETVLFGEDSDGLMYNWPESSTGVPRENVLANPFYDNRETLTSITFNPGLKTIGNLAFTKNTVLEGDVEIPDGVTSIGYRAFFGSTKIAEVILPNSVTTLGAGAFRSMTGLQRLEIPETVKDIPNNLCYGDSNLASLTLNEGLESIGRLGFYSNTSLEDITIPDSCIFIGTAAFYNASSAETLTFGAGDPAENKTAYIGPSAFQGAGISGAITLPPNLEVLGDQAFAAIYNARTTTIEIPKSVWQIGGTIKNRSWNTEYASYNKTNFRTEPYGTTGVNPFWGMGQKNAQVYWLGPVTVASENTHFKAIDGALYTIDEKRLISYNQLNTRYCGSLVPNCESFDDHSLYKIKMIDFGAGLTTSKILSGTENIPTSQVTSNVNTLSAAISQAGYYGVEVVGVEGADLMVSPAAEITGTHIINGVYSIRDVSGVDTPDTCYFLPMADWNMSPSYDIKIADGCRTLEGCFIGYGSVPTLSTQYDAGKRIRIIIPESLTTIDAQTLSNFNTTVDNLRSLGAKYHAKYSDKPAELWGLDFAFADASGTVMEGATGNAYWHVDEDGHLAAGAAS